MRTLALLFFVVSLSVVAVACGASKCGPGTCSGCCDSKGTCQSPTTATCGAAGGVCTSCALGLQCFAGVCTSGSTGSQGGGVGSTGGGGGSGGGGGGSSGGGGGTSGGGGGTGTTTCTTELQQIDGSGGCRLRITSPADCATLDWNALGSLYLEWSTDGSSCEAPHHLFFLGSPANTWNGEVTDTNGTDITLASTNGNEVAIGNRGSSYAVTSTAGGYLKLVRDDVAAITTVNGQYHFFVTGFYALNNGGSRSASRSFFAP